MDESDSMKAQLYNHLPLLLPNYLDNVLELAAVVVNHTPSNADDNIDHNWTYNSGNAFRLLVADAVADDDDGNDGGGDNLVTDLPKNNRHDCMNLMFVDDLALSLDHHHLLVLLRLLLLHHRVPMTKMPMLMPLIVESAADYHLNQLQPLRADYDDFGYALVMMHYFQIEHHTHYKNCSCCYCWYCCCYCCWRYWRCWYQRQCHCHYYSACYFHVAQTTEEPMQPHSVFLRVPLFFTAPHTKFALSSSSLLLRRLAHRLNIKINQKIIFAKAYKSKLKNTHSHTLTARYRCVFFYLKTFF